MLSPSITQELRITLAALVDQRKLIDNAIEAIEQLIAGVPVGSVPVTSEAGYVSPPPPAPVQHDDVPIKELVKEVLRIRPGIKSAVVTEILRKRGFKPSGTTRITHRVYNEIWRMVQSGEVERADRGGFVLTEKGAQ